LEEGCKGGNLEKGRMEGRKETKRKEGGTFKGRKERRETTYRKEGRKERNYLEGKKILKRKMKKGRHLCNAALHSCVDVGRALKGGRVEGRKEGR
jgi:hypothetical protein